MLFLFDAEIPIAVGLPNLAALNTHPNIQFLPKHPMSNDDYAFAHPGLFFTSVLSRFLVQIIV